MTAARDPAGRRVGVVAVGRPTFDTYLGRQQVVAARALLARVGVDVVDAGDSDELVTTERGLDVAIERLQASDPPIELVVVLQATFTDASGVVDLAERIAAPIVVWSFPEPRVGGRLRLNSLCGANLAAHSLRRRGRRAEFVHVAPAEKGARRAVRRTLRAAADPEPQALGRRPRPAAHDTVSPAALAVADRVAADLRHATIGVFGEGPDGFEPCDYDADTLAALTGVTCETHDLAELFAASDAVPAGAVAATRGRIEDALELGPDLADRDLDPSLRLYGGLRDLARDRQLDVVATRCWPECMTDYGGAVCAAQALLTEDGVPAACEADVLGGITTLMLTRVAGSHAFLADLVDVDREDNTSAMWHCGVAPVTLADRWSHRRATVHPNRGCPLVFDFLLHPGRVTVARITQLAGGGLGMVIAGGEMLHRPQPYVGTVGVLRWDAPVGLVLDTVFGLGLEHHFGVVYGDHREELEALAAIWGIEVVELDRRTRPWQRTIEREPVPIGPGARAW